MSNSPTMSHNVPRLSLSEAPAAFRRCLLVSCFFFFLDHIYLFFLYHFPSNQFEKVTS